MKVVRLLTHPFDLKQTRESRNSFKCYSVQDTVGI